MNVVLLIAFLLFAWRRMLTYLHIYQQEEYDSARFLRWLVSGRAYDKRATLALFILGITQFFGRFFVWIAPLVAAVALVLVALVEKDPRSTGKKRLVMTARAKRISLIAALFVVAAALALCISGAPVLVWILGVQFIPFALVLGNLVLAPYEKSTQQRFWNEAHAKLQSLKPTVIGITGSYGKTSTKHLLGHILELQAPTLITPGSVNTPMGIARVIREKLAPHHRFFVCEMGAYGPGSIARLCRLAPPDMALITAVGMAHYERFKTLETVAKAKFELPEAAAQRNGWVVINEQVLNFEAPKNFIARYADKTITVGSSPDCAAKILAAAQTAEGIRAEVEWRGELYVLAAPIYGEHHISNMVIAFTAACLLGVSPRDAILALRSAPQISHRLELKTAGSGARIIDDAYNSNPAGFASALRLLDALRVNGGRRILVTPGMVELGPAHDPEHAKIGQLAATHADVLLAVAPERIKALTTAYTHSNPNGLVVECPDFRTAQSWMDANLQPSDVVLLENDLPDVYEQKLKL